MLDPVTREGEIYSSTRIREALRAGWVIERHRARPGLDECGQLPLHILGRHDVEVALATHGGDSCVTGRHGSTAKQPLARALPTVRVAARVPTGLSASNLTEPIRESR